MKNFLIFVTLLLLLTQGDALTRRWKTDAATKLFNDTRFMGDTTSFMDRWCPGSTEKVLVAIDELIECIDSDRHQTLCGAIREKGFSCFRNLIEVAQDCIPLESEEIPEMAVRSVISGFEFVCKQKGSNILELSDNCLYDSGKHGKDVAECMQNPNRLAEQFKQKSPGRTEICDFARMVRACVAIQTNRECESWAAKRTIHGLYDAFLAPCNQKVQF